MKKSIIILFVALAGSLTLSAANNLKIYTTDGKVFKQLGQVSSINDLLGISGELQVVSCTITINNRSTTYTSEANGRMNFKEFLNKNFTAESQGVSLTITNISVLQSGLPIAIKDISYKVGN